MNIVYDKKLRKKILRYIFLAIIAIRIFITVWLIYQYVLSVAKDSKAKGGTFVEAIFNNTSFLPYLGDTAQSSFYQGLLFKSCLSHNTNQEGSFVENMCSISTRNNKDFYITVHTGHTRSDGTPLTIDDVLFTFQEIIINNTRQIPMLNIYSNNTVSLENNGSIKVSFPKTSTDNILFFTQYILPKHILQNQGLDFYRDDFGNKPVYANCAGIKPQNTDTNSLIFDLNKCTNTHLGFYQIKNYNSFESFAQTTRSPSTNIVDVYLYPEQASGFDEFSINTSTYNVMFFNTQSPRLRVRLRRSLAGFINSYFSDYSDRHIQTDRRIFNKFLTDGSTIDEFISRITPDASLNKQDLEESNVTAIPNTITFDEKNRKYAYYLEKTAKNIQVNIKRNNTYENLRFKHNDKDLGTVSNFNTKDKTATFTIKSTNIQAGLNTYTLYTRKDGKDIHIGSITIYFLTNIADNEQGQETLRIIYQQTPHNNHIVGLLQGIFQEHDIQDFFERQELGTSTEMEEALNIGNYDIAIINIAKGQRRDISPILRSDVAAINPSQYKNNQLTSLFEQYLQNSTTNQTIVNQIQNIYATDMPFIFLGKIKETMYIKPLIADSIRQNFTGDLYEYNRRSIIYKHAVITQNIHINTAENINRKGFREFIHPSAASSQKNTVEDRANIYQQYIN